MQRSKIPSPARSQEAPVTPRRYKTRGPRSVGSTTPSRLSAVIDQYTERPRDSLPLSPLQKTVLNDETDIEQPRRSSWWKKVNNSRDITEVLDGNMGSQKDVTADEEVAILSQDNKEFSLDLPESSDSESIHSIVMPQRKLFPQKENKPQHIPNQDIKQKEVYNKNLENTLDLPESSSNESIGSIVIPQRRLFVQKENKTQKRFGQVINKRQSLTKLDKTKLSDKLNDVAPKELSNQVGKSTQNISSDKTLASKTKDLSTVVQAQPRNLFGNRPATNNKRKNMFAAFVVSESEDEISDIQPTLFAFQKNRNPVRHSSSKGVREPSPSSSKFSITTDIEMDDWKLLPSSTMVEHQLEAMVIASSPAKRTRLSKLSEAKESGTTINTNNTADKTKQSNKSVTSKNNSKLSNKEDNEADTSLSKRKSKTFTVHGDSRKTCNENLEINEEPKQINKEQIHTEGSDDTDTRNKTRTLNKSRNDKLPSNQELINESETDRSPKLDIESVEIGTSNSKNRLLKEPHDEVEVDNNEPLVYQESDDEVQSEIVEVGNENNSNNLQLSKEIIENKDTEIGNYSSVVHDECDKQQEQGDQNTMEGKQNERDVNQNDNVKDEKQNENELPTKDIENKDLMDKAVDYKDDEQDSNVDMDAHGHDNEDDIQLDENNEHDSNTKQAQIENDEDEEKVENECVQPDENNMEEDESQEDEEQVEKDEEQEYEDQDQADEDDNHVEEQSVEVENSENNLEIQDQEGEKEIDEVCDETNQEDDNEMRSEIVQDKENEEIKRYKEIEQVPQDKDMAEIEQDIQNEAEELDDNDEENEEVERDEDIEQDEDVAEAEQVIENETEEQDENDEEDEEVELDEENEEAELDEENEEVERDEDIEQDEDVAEAEQVIENETEELDENDEEDEEVELDEENNEVEIDEDNEEVERDEDEEREQDEMEDVEQYIENESVEVDESAKVELDEENEEEQHEKENVESEQGEHDDNSNQEQDDREEELEQDNVQLEQDAQDDTDQIQEDTEEEIENQEHESEIDSNEQDSDNIEDSEAQTDSNVIQNTDPDVEERQRTVNEEEIPNQSHDTTGRHRKKNDTQSPEIPLHEKTNNVDSFIGHGRNTSIRKTKSILKNFSIRPSMAPPRDSTGFSEGTRNSSAEGSGWDSHRNERKTLRQTFGKDFTPRKSLRALVMEKSAKRRTIINEANAELRLPQANSTELPTHIPDDEDDMVYEDDVDVAEESNHEVSIRTRQATLEMFLQKMKQNNEDRKLQIERQVKLSLKENTQRVDFFNRAAYKPTIRRPGKSIQIAAKKRSKPTFKVPLEDLPPEMMEDLNYKPPKRFKASSAPWITKRLYKFLETKLEPKYDYKSRVRAEKLVESIYEFTREIKRVRIAPPPAVAAIAREMARLDVVKTHFEFYDFVRDYLPAEIKVKIVPDIVNDIPLPRNGIFANILSEEG